MKAKKEKGAGNWRPYQSTRLTVMNHRHQPMKRNHSTSHPINLNRVDT
jgi:hypothetical protein